MATNKIKRASSASNPYFTHAALAFGIAAVGLIVAFALIWWQLVMKPAQDQADIARDQTMQRYSEFYNGRIAELRTTVNVIANSATATDSIALFDEASQSQFEAISKNHPHIRRVAMFERGKAEVDLNSEVPISFGALDLIRRAETSEFIGPEVSLNQRNLIYAAQPITPNGVVAGVLLVVFDSSFFLAPLNHVEGLQGRVEILQSFAGSPAQAVISHGAGTDLRPSVETTLVAPHWKLAYAAPTKTNAATQSTSDILMPLAAALALLLGGVFLGFTRLSRKVDDDAGALTVFVARVMQGAAVRPSDMHLPQLREAAKAIATDNNVPKPGAEVAAQVTDAAAEPKADEPESIEEDDLELSDQFLHVGSAKPKDNFGIEVSEQVSPADMGVRFDPTMFRAYDIRGITTKNLTEDVVYWIGRAFAAQALSEGQERTAVGWDGRHSSDPLQASLIRGLTEGGIDVVSIGMVPTPLLYYATHALDTGTGIMITGSHNPPKYNGLKMMIGGVTLAEESIQALLIRLQENNLSAGEGEVDHIDLEDGYIDRMLEDIAVALPPKVVVDCGNGVAGKIAPRLLRELGCEVVELYCEVDGDFPNHHPDPADPDTLDDLRTVVEAENAELGLAFDGDGDRLGVVTNTGEIIWPDKLIMLFAQDIVGRNPGADIIYDVKCSRHLNRLISDMGGRPIMWKTGHSHIKAKIKETGALLGGEFSGHICFAERWYGFDDALYSAVRLLEILGAEGGTADEVFEQFPVTFTTPEIKIETTDSAKFEIMDKLTEIADFGDATLTTIDGLRVDYPDGWGLIRLSNTSPVLTLRFEADNAEELDRIQDDFQAQLHRVDSTLSFR